MKIDCNASGDAAPTPARWNTVQAIAESLESLDLDVTLRTVRNALVEHGGFDRAGILLLDEDDPRFLLGTWGSTPTGEPRPEHAIRTRVEDHPNSSRILAGEAPYVVTHVRLPELPEPPGTPADHPQHAVVPLKSGDRMLGVLSVDNAVTQRAIGPEDVRFLQLVAGPVGLAVSKARAHRREQDRIAEVARESSRYAHRLEGLQRASAAVAASQSLADALEAVLNAAAEVLDADRLAVWQVDSDGHWGCPAGRGLSAAYRDIPLRSDDSAFTREYTGILHAGEPIVVDDAAADPRWEFRRQIAVDEGIGSLVIYPLRVAGALLGTLVFYGDRPGRFTAEDIALGRLFAHHAAIAVHNARSLDALQRARDSLAERVVERTAQLEEARDQVVRSERLAAIGQLSATVAHELRNPLGVITNAAFLLEMRLKDPDDKVAQVIGTLRNQVGACESIINRLLDFSRDIQPRCTPARWRSIVNAALESLPAATQSRVELAIDPALPPAPMDPDLMARAVNNLILNASQVAGPDRPIRVDAGADGDSTWLSVSDEGPGVPDELRDRIFEPLFTTRAKGTGLGLPLVKRIVEAHDGRITIEARDPHGARFVIRLPVTGA